MPLLVHCPNNCQIRIPANRTGKVVRCAECQTPIRIPALDSPLLRTGNLVECRAKRAIKKPDATNAATDFPSKTWLPSETAPIEQSLPANQDIPASPTLPSSPNADLTIKPLRQTARLLRAKPWRMVQPLTRIDPEASSPPINLEIEPTTTCPAEDCNNSNAGSDTEQSESVGLPLRRPSWLLFVRKILCLQTPNDKEPPKSV